MAQQKGEYAEDRNCASGKSKLCSCSTIPQAHSSFRWNIEADIMIAPRVNLHPQLQGRIMVVDSKESLGPHLVKGCLGMDFLDSFIGDSQSFLKTKKRSFFLCHTNFRRLNRKKCTITRCRCSRKNRPRHNVYPRTDERII